MGVTDELLKLKQLLDANAITQEEFDSMKGHTINLTMENTTQIHLVLLNVIQKDMSLEMVY